MGKRLEQNLRDEVGEQYVQPVSTFEVLEKEVRRKKSIGNEVLIGKSVAGSGVGEEQGAHPEEDPVGDKNRKGVQPSQSQGGLCVAKRAGTATKAWSVHNPGPRGDGGDGTDLEEPTTIGPVKTGTGDRPGESDDTTELHAPDPATDEDFDGNQNSVTHLATLRRFYPRYKTDAFDWYDSNIRIGTEYEKAWRAMSFRGINACKDHGSEDVRSTHAAEEGTTSLFMQ